MAWPSSLLEQRALVADLRNRIQALGYRFLPETTYDLTTTAAEKATIWEEASGGIQPPQGALLQEFDSVNNILRNTYQNLSVLGGSGAQFQSQSAQAEDECRLLGEAYATATADPLTILLPDAANYKDLLVIASVRLSGAGNGIINVQVNANAGAVYGSSTIGQAGAAQAFTVAGTTVFSWGNFAADDANKVVSTLLHLHFHNHRAATIKATGFLSSLHGAAFAAANRFMGTLGGVANIAGPITRLDFTGSAATLIRRGTHIQVYGLHPI